MNAVSQTLDIHRPDDQQIVPASDAPMVAMIERIAMDPSIPIERLERMLAMKERMEDRAREDEKLRAQKAYFAAKAACQKELPIVIRKKRNTHTNSNYADLAAIEEQAMPIIHNYGFGVTFQPAGYNDKGELQIKWQITHAEGHSESDIAGIPVDGAGSQGKVNKTGTQAFGSTATYGRRYLLCMLFNISTGDDKDGNKVEDTSGPISEEQRIELEKVLDECGADRAIFGEKWKVETLAEFPANKFDAAIKDVRRWFEREQRQQKAGS